MVIKVDSKTEYKYEMKNQATNETDTSTITVPVGHKNDDKKINSQDNIEETSQKNEKKTARTLDEAMRIAYPKWDKMSEEEKQQTIIKHVNMNKDQFKYLATKENPDGRVGFLKSFLTNDRMNENEVKTVVGALKQLDSKKDDMADLQAKGVKMVFDKDNQNREVGQLKVTEDMDKYGVKAQKVAVENSAKSDFDSVKIKGATKIAKLDESIQTSAVEQYREGAKKSSLAVQNAVDKKIVNQYGDFAKGNQVNIHKQMMTSKFQEILEEASKNVYKFHKDNQKLATQITINTNNEGAINALASTIYKFSKDNQSEIKDSLSNTGYKSVQKTLENAKSNPTQNILKETVNSSNNNEATTSETTTSINDVYSNSKTSGEKKTILEKMFAAEPTVQGKMKLLNSLPDNIKKAALTQIAKSLPTALLQRYLSIEDIKMLLNENNLSDDVKNKLYTVTENMSAADKKNFVTNLAKMSEAQLKAKRPFLSENLYNKAMQEKTSIFS